MHITCLEISSSVDVNVLDLSIDNNFCVSGASMKEIDQSISNTFSAYYNNEISFDEIVKSLDYFLNTKADFIILTQQQTDHLSLMNDAITVGRKGQQIHLLEFNNDSLRKVLLNA